MPQVQLILPEGPLAPLEFELGARPNLELLQKWVGGLIETVYFEDDPSGLWHIGYVNEEGLIHQLPRNRFAEKVFVRYPPALSGVDVAEMAQRFGGGGHARAAGFELDRIENAPGVR